MEFSIEIIKNLLDAFEERNMQKLQLKQGEFEIVLERTPARSEIITASPMQAAHQHAGHHLPLHFSAPERQAPVIEAKSPVEDTTAKHITSPMVGTFYRSAAPGEAAFVSVGSSVKAGDVVCIIEAMKVMNEVKATESGIVKEVLVENGHPVEFGTKIFKLS